MGINLNIGHLNLASKAFKFSKLEFVKSLKPYIIALELSHNNGKEDQHLPLRKNKWYWDIINRIKTYRTWFITILCMYNIFKSNYIHTKNNQNHKK